MGDLLENRLKMHGKPFLAGTASPTLADFSVGCIYYNIAYNTNEGGFGELGTRIKDEVVS